MRLSEQKIFNGQPQALSAFINSLPRPLVFTNGCFDILHRGHVTYLEQARQLGAALVVGVNSDASVRSLNKAPERPINILADRMAVLASLESVDAVIAFEESTPLNLIVQIQPDFLVKGGDWDIKDIVGAKQVTEYGGQVCSIAFEHERSTTALIEKVRGSH